MDLFGRELIAIDGTFIKAVNSKARSFTRTKLEKLIATCDGAAARYLEQLERTDEAESATGADASGRAVLEAKLEKIRERKTELQGYQEDCEKSPTGQVNLTDPESVQLRKNGQSTTGYNVQAAVDDKQHLVAAVELTQDGNDKRQLDPMAQEAKAAMGYGAGVLCRGKEFAGAEVKLSFWSNNFKRALKVLGVHELIRQMREASAARRAAVAA